jgi:hypothetical protein
MKTTHSIRNLSLFAILTVLGATAHAAPSYQPQQLAENGSQRALEQADKARADRALKVAEGGSERSPKRATNSQTEHQELAENGSQRALEQADKARADRALKVAEGGSDRLQAWHAARSA